LDWDYPLHAHPQVVYRNCVKLHQYQFISAHRAVKEEFRLQDIWTDGRTGWFLYTSQNSVSRGYNHLVLSSSNSTGSTYWELCDMLRRITNKTETSKV